MWRRAAGAVVVMVLAALAVGVPTVPAAAEPPARVEGRVADRADVLNRAAKAEVEAALERLETSTTMRLTVILVEEFDPPEEEDGSPSCSPGTGRRRPPTVPG